MLTIWILLFVFNVNLSLIQKLIACSVFNAIIQAQLTGNLRVVWQHPLLNIVGGYSVAIENINVTEWRMAEDIQGLVCR